MRKFETNFGNHTKKMSRKRFFESYIKSIIFDIIAVYKKTIGVDVTRA